MSDEPRWTHKGYSVNMNIPPGPEHDRLKALMEETTRRMANDVARLLYAPNPLFDHLTRNFKPLTRRERLIARFRNYRRRVCDAWLVLTGKADIE